MTTIAYRDGVMAADSRCSTDDFMHLTECKKLFRMVGGAVMGTAGDDDAREVMKLFEGVQDEGGLPDKDTLSLTRTGFLGLLLLPDTTLWRVEVEWVEHDHEGEWNAFVSEITHEFAAVGSGAPFAYGAMTVGADAPEAVKAAIKLDLFSAGKIQKMTLKGN